MTAVTSPRLTYSFRVFVIPGSVAGTGLYYQWDISKFQLENRLIPERISDRPGGMGSASFRLLRSEREENGIFINDRGQVDLGTYIAVTRDVGGGVAFSRTNVIWWGFISRRDIVELAGGIDKVGSVTALGLGYILDSPISGFRQAVSGAASAEMTNPPTFNLEGDGGVIIGNKVFDNKSKPVLAALPSECSTTALWSRSAILDHILAYAKPDGVPTLGTGASDSSVMTYLDDTVSSEVFDLSGVTIKGAIDLLVSRTNGFGWKIVPNASNTVGGWDIVVYPLLDAIPAAYGSGYPKATTINVNLTAIEGVEVAYVEDAADLYDSVTVEGSPIIVGCTPSMIDGNLVKGWAAAQETAFRAGAKNASDYNSISLAQKQARNEQIRNSAELADVFSLFTLNMTGTTIKRSDSPGTGGGSKPLIPSIKWDGTAATVGDDYKTPYLPLARFARNVPWLVGVKGDGTDNRSAESKARPAFLEPRVFIYDTALLDGKSVCEDVLVPSTTTNVRPCPTVTPDDRCPGLRISFSPNEYCARGHWTDGTDGVSRIGNISSSNRCFDHDLLSVTVGIPSDQRVSVTINRDGVTNEKSRRDLYVRDSTLQCWVTLAGTIVGTNKDGGADRVAVHTFARNDFPAAQRMATMLAAFAFRKRTAVQITMAEPDNLPAWAAIGTFLGTLTEAAATGPFPALVADAYTCVEAIDYDLSRERPRVTVSTTMPSPPSGMVGGSPSSGGSVSVSLGGTVSQALCQAQADIRDIGLRTTKIATTPGESVGSLPYMFVNIVSGNTLDSGQLGVKYSSSAITSVPSAYDPNVTSSFIDGIGRGTLYINGVVQAGYVLVVNDTNGVNRNAVIIGENPYTGGTVAIPISGGGGTSVNAYVIC